MYYKLTITVHKTVDFSLNAINAQVGGGVLPACLAVRFHFDPVLRLVRLFLQRRWGRQRR